MPSPRVAAAQAEPVLHDAMPFRRTTVDVEGVRLSAVDDGPRDARETLLFLHGNPTWSYLWRRFLAAGLAEGHRVVAPDHAGFGLSDKPEDPGYYSLTRHVENLRAVVRALDLRDVTLVLHDWGGPIGMGFAVAEPERVRRIVVTNTLLGAPQRKRPFSHWHRLFGSPAGFRAGVALNLVGHSAMTLGVRRRLPRDVYRAYLGPLRERGARVAAGRFVQMVPDGPDHPEAATFRAIEAGLPRLAEKPGLVLWADADPVIPARHAERWRTFLPGVVDVRHVAPEAGHFWQEDAPDAFLPHVLTFVEHDAVRPGVPV